MYLIKCCHQTVFHLYNKNLTVLPITTKCREKIQPKKKRKVKIIVMNCALRKISLTRWEWIGQDFLNCRTFCGKNKIFNPGHNGQAHRCNLMYSFSFHR